MKKLSVIKIYARQRPFFLGLIRSVEVGLFRKYFLKKGPVLDLGCGDGFFASLAFGRLDVGADLEGSRISEAKQSKVYKKLITFNGTNIPLPDRAVTTVVSNCVLEHVEQLGDLLKDTYRILRPGGRIYATVMNQPWEENLLGTRLFGERYKKFMRKTQNHNNLLTAVEWNKKFRKAGFKIIVEKGYLTPRACKIIEVAHYFSFPSLIIHYLWGKWSLGTGWVEQLNLTKLESALEREIDPVQAGALFIVAMKTSGK